MAKVATVKFSWTKSPSADVVKVTAELTINGTTTTTDYGPEVESFVIDIAASSSGVLQLTVVDGEGLTAITTYAWSIPDLENPLPVTNVIHEILSIHDA